MNSNGTLDNYNLLFNPGEVGMTLKLLMIVKFINNRHFDNF